MKRKAWFLYCFQFLLLAGLLFPIGCSTTQAPNNQLRDSRITAQVKTKMASQVQPSSLTNVSVNTTNGVVTLSGQVENEEIRHRAELVARAVPGVVGVNNDLQTQGHPAAQAANQTPSREQP